MANEIDICNAALSILGEAATIVSVKPSDGSEMAGLCARWYPMACRRLFEEHDWSFAQKRARLSELTGVDAEIYGGEKCYGCPSDAVRIIDRSELTDRNGQYFESARELGYVDRNRWRIEDNPGNDARMIVTNVDTAVAHYTAYLSSPALYPQYFVEPLVVLLASYLSGPLKRQSSASTEAANLLRQYQASLSAAKTIDATFVRRPHASIPSSIHSRWV